MRQGHFLRIQIMFRLFRSLPRWLQFFCTIVSALGGLITIGFFVYSIVGLPSANKGIQSTGTEAIGVSLPETNSVAMPVATSVAVPVAIPIVVEPQPTATPTPVPPLQEQLDRALSIQSSSAQGEGLATVVVQAILLGDYWIAIRAAAATPSTYRQSTNLELVVKCAIEDGRFSMATEAASRARSSSSNSQLMILALKAREVAIKDQLSSGSAPEEHPQRSSMLCLETDGS